mmetsp:Transcript_101416/g.282548  ORF Transcript_101416/g.282548 Transcript_101416/m.282548 type:complete len:122 (+) Transcript_101416:2-367(+)
MALRKNHRASRKYSKGVTTEGAPSVTQWFVSQLGMPPEVAAAYLRKAAAKPGAIAALADAAKSDAFGAAPVRTGTFGLTAAEMDDGAKVSRWRAGAPAGSEVALIVPQFDPEDEGGPPMDL